MLTATRNVAKSKKARDSKTGERFTWNAMDRHQPAHLHATSAMPPTSAYAQALGASPLNADVVEFESWLEALLDACGADGPLYARCVLSILREKSIETETIPMSVYNLRYNMLQSADILERTCVLKNVTACRDSVLSFPQPSHNGISSGAAATNCSQTMSEDSATAADCETRRLALIDCLRTVETDSQRLSALADNIFARYAQAVNQGEKDPGNVSQNESIDSGVCPSPVESEQNYDEAFPRLFDVDEDVQNQPGLPLSGLPYGQRRAKEVSQSTDEEDYCKPTMERPRATKMTAPIPIPTPAHCTLRQCDSEVSPASAFKATSAFVAASEGEQDQQAPRQRSLGTSMTSSSDRGHSSLGTSQSTLVRVAIPRASTQCSRSSRPMHVHSIAANSLPSSSIGNKLLAPFTREWATRSAEMFHGPVTSTSCPTTTASAVLVPIVQTVKAHPTTLAMLMAAHHAAAIAQPQFIVARAPVTIGGGAALANMSRLEYCYCEASRSRGPQHYHHHSTRASPAVVVSTAEKLSQSLDAKCETQRMPRFLLPAIMEQKTGRGGQQATGEQRAHPRDPQASVDCDARVQQADQQVPAFAFDPWMNAIEAENNSLTAVAQCENEDENAILQDFFCIPRLEDMDAKCQLSLPEPTQAFLEPVLESDGGVKIPVSPATHFVPIRSESMEDAYLPVDDYGETRDAIQQYAMEFYGAERYFVLRADAATTTSVTGQVTPSGRNRRSLPIKFKAVLPEKHCQTEVGCQTMRPSDPQEPVRRASIASISHQLQTYAMRDGERMEHCDELVDPWTARSATQRKQGRSLANSASWIAHNASQQSAFGQMDNAFVEVSPSHQALKDGDNTVALPDAWANSVWEPRLSLASTSSTARQSPVSNSAADDSGIGEASLSTSGIAIQSTNGKFGVANTGKDRRDDDDEDAFLSWMMRKATSQLTVETSTTDRCDPWLTTTGDFPSRRRSDASACRAAESAAAVRRVHSDDAESEHNGARLQASSDDDDADALLRYVSNINLLSPLNSADDRTTTTTAARALPMLLQLSPAETTTINTASAALTVT